MKKWTRRAIIAGVGATALGITDHPDAMADGTVRASSASPPIETASTAQTTGHAGLGRNPFVFSADDVNYDNKLNIVIARGNVEISQNNRTLYADAVSYNQSTDTVIASGHVVLVEAGGANAFGNYVELSDDMRNGFIKDIRLLMADRSRTAANTGRRVDGNWTELRHVVYSPCDICAKDPKHPPTWQIKADRVVYDRASQTIRYHGAWIEIDGVPVLYTPYLSHPAPSIKRQSGFLIPQIGSSTQLGYHASIPYFWDIAPNKDFLFDPVLTTENGVVLAGRYRQRFSNGYLSAFASGTDAFNGYSTGDFRTGDRQLRGNVKAQGVFDLTDQLRAGFDLNRATDQTYTRVYNYSNSESFLTSDAWLEDFDGRNYGNVTAYSFQALRQGLRDRTQPISVPTADYTWYNAPNSWGGQFTSNVDLLDELRLGGHEYGPSTQRVSVGTRYDQPFTTPDGEVFHALGSVRGDGYNVTNLPGQTGPSPYYTGTQGRVFPQAGLEWRYPFARYSDGSSVLIEPHAAVYAAPNGGNRITIPNNDSQAFNYSDADLFVPDRLYGLDQVDSGQRVDYALHAGWFGKSGRYADGLFGESYRFQKQSIFQPGTGLETQRSDFVGRLTFVPTDSINMTYHARLAENDFRIRNQRFDTTFKFKPAQLTLSYISLGNNTRDGLGSLQQLGATINYYLTEYWTIQASTVRNLDSDTSASTVVPGVTPYYSLFIPSSGYTSITNSLANRIGVSYSNNCLSFIASYVESGTRDRDLKPGNAILFQLVLKNLGAINLPSVHFDEQ